MTGRAADAIEAINAGLEAYRSSGAKAHIPVYLAALARAYACCGQFEPARITIYHALDVADATRERWAEAEIHRTAGEITLLSTNPGMQKAESHFLHGVTIARKQEARSYELRTATSLARLWRDQGRPDEARDLLAQIYGWFTEGFDTRDLKEAKALLEQLAA
jgi:predicted ATPase